MGRFPIIFTLALSAAASAQAPQPRSRDEALALPTVEAARALLGNVASRFVTMTVEKNGEVPVEVAFATAPAGTGLPGLCEATVLRFSLVREEDRRAPAEFRGYSVGEVYKVISEVDGPLGPLGPNEREQARRCAEASPVLPAPGEGERAARFFGYRGYGAPWLGVAALQGAIRTARRGRYGQIECRRRQPSDCQDPQADLAALDLRNLMSVDVFQPNPDQPNFRVHASFVVEPGQAFSHGWQVSLEFNGEPLPVMRRRRASFVYGRTRLYRY